MTELSKVNQEICKIADSKQKVLGMAGGRHIILFDGVCNLCSGAVDFILSRDPTGKFAFASLQSGAGQEILSSMGLSTENFDSLVLVKNGKIYKKSRAALEISSGLNNAWPLLQVFKFVPRFISDAVYDFIAKNRYRFFGKLESCRVPSPDIRNRFLEGL